MLGDLRATFKGAELSSPGTLTVMPAVSSILQSLMISFRFFPSVTIWILHMVGYKMIKMFIHTFIQYEEELKEDIRMLLGGTMVGWLKLKRIKQGVSENQTSQEQQMIKI